jgi:hypothetical protein
MKPFTEQFQEEINKLEELEDKKLLIEHFINGKFALDGTYYNELDIAEKDYINDIKFNLTYPDTQQRMSKVANLKKMLNA